MARLSYAFDPLCGWCFGFIPALEALRRARPNVAIEPRLGGLVTGERVRPYGEMAGYIRGASDRLAAVTGQRLAPAFFDRILGDPAILGSSTPPSWVILHVKKYRPEAALDFSHAVQRAHFGRGADLNDQRTYVDLLREAGVTEPVTLPPPDDPPAELAAEYAATRAMGGVSFPMLFVHRGGTVTALPSTYDPAALVRQVTEALERT